MQDAKSQANMQLPFPFGNLSLYAEQSFPYAGCEKEAQGGGSNFCCMTKKEKEKEREGLTLWQANTGNEEETKEELKRD